MNKFTIVTSIAAYLPIINVDTDMIIPKQYLKTIKRTGLGQCLFAELRYDESGKEKPDFILNQTPWQDTKILLAADNFACGSSREHAVWSLLDFGIQVIIAPSFGDIFYNNAFKNGLLLIRLPKLAIDELAQISTPISINLQEQTIYFAEKEKKFSLENHLRTALLEGLDEIAETLKFQEAIVNYEQYIQQQRPWINLNKQTIEEKK